MTENFKQKIHKKQFIYVFAILIFFIVNFLIFVKPVAAQDFWTGFSNTLGGAVALLLGWVALLITAFLGLVTSVLVQVLINIAQFNNIINVYTVRVGWTTIRDICNMFFILILLIIAFGTILRIESYNAKKMLPKLIIMAILINFSKTIFGLIIDFSQVIMLTFVNSFKDSSGLFIEMFNMRGVLTGSKQLQGITNSSSGWTNWALSIAIIAGIFASIVTLVVVAVFVAILAIRIVMLWIYTILSPFVFLGMALPSLQKYTARIWDDFIKQVMIGPILAFFIWLAITTVDTSSGELTRNTGVSMGLPTNTTLMSGTGINNQLCISEGISDFFCDQNLQRYIIFIGLMMGGLMVAQGMGGAAGSIAGKGMGKIMAAGGLGYALGKRLGKDTGKLASRTALMGGSIMGVGAKEGSTRGKIGSFVNQWGKDLKDSRQDEKKKKRLRTLEKLGMKDKVGGSLEKLKTVAEDDKVKRAVNITKGVGIATAGVVTGNVPLAIAAIAAGTAKATSKKGIIADTLENRGKGRELIDAEKDQETIKTNVEENKKRELAPLEANRDFGKKVTEEWRQRELSSLEQYKPRNIKSDAEKKEYADLVAHINKKADNAILDHDEDFSKQKTEVDKRYQPRLDAAGDKVKVAREKQSTAGKAMESWGKEMKGPNHITIEAIKKGTEENNKTHKTVQELGEENVHEFNKNTWYSPGGPTSQQQKMFDALNSSSAAAAKAMKQMADSLKASKNSLKPLEMQNIIGLKQLIASQKTAGKDLSKFGELINVLNTVDTSAHDKRGRITIDDFSKNTGSAETD